MLYEVPAPEFESRKPRPAAGPLQWRPSGPRELHGKPATWPGTAAAVPEDPSRARGAGGARAALGAPRTDRGARDPLRADLRLRGRAARGAAPPHLAHLVAREPPECGAQLRCTARRLQRLPATFVRLPHRSCPERATVSRLSEGS